jgi:hypothetical protein
MVNAAARGHEVVETDVHHPTDSTLLGDAARVKRQG